MKNKTAPAADNAAPALAGRQAISGRRGVGSPKRRSDEIIAAAAEVFAERSYHGSTTQDIADRVGVRQATLYYYIPSKEVALEQVCIIGIEGMADAAMAVAATELSDLEKIERIVRNHIQAIEQRLAFMQVLLRERQHLPATSRKQVGDLSRKYEEILQTIIESGIATGQLRASINPRVTTLAILGACNSTSVWYNRNRGTKPDSKLIAQGIVDFVIPGIAATPANLAATPTPAA